METRATGFERAQNRDGRVVSCRSHRVCSVLSLFARLWKLRFPKGTRHLGRLAFQAFLPLAPWSFASGFLDGFQTLAALDTGSGEP